MQTGRIGRLGVASLGLAAMVTSALAFTAGAPQPTAGEQLAAELAVTNGVTSLVRVQADGREQVELLSDQFDLTEHGRDGWYDVVAYPGDRDRLEAFGFVYEVVTEDLVALDIATREAEAVLAQQLREQGPTDLQPGERIEGYRTWADYDAEVRQLAKDNPEFVRLIELPNETHQGRTVVGLHIAQNPDQALTDGRPSSILMGLHHAREWPSAELTMMFAYDLIQQYNDGDKEVADILAKTNLFLIPVVNPDGYVRSREFISDFIVPGPGAQAAVSEFAYHRKNMRPHESLDGLTGQGTDPNRNYPYKWGGPGTSTSTGAATYHGPGPASEPEIDNVLSLLRANHVTTLISNHTYSNLVLRPFGDTMRDTPDEAIIKGHADAMAAINGYSSIKGLELYATTGTTEDWVYGVTGAPSFTFEISEPGVVLGNLTPVECAGFHPNYQLCVGDFYKLNRDAYMLNLKQASNNDWHSRLVGKAPAGTVLNLVKEVDVPLSVPHPETGEDFMAERLDATMVVGPKGTFEWHVNPSPMPQTILDIEDGFLRPGDEETYTLTATYPNGKVKVIKNLLVMRGNVYKIKL